MEEASGKYFQRSCMFIALNLSVANVKLVEGVRACDSGVGLL